MWLSKSLGLGSNPSTPVLYKGGYNMKQKSSKIAILATVFVFLLVCVSFASIWTLANPTMETTTPRVVDN